MKQIFHPFHLWEDHKHKFYNNNCDNKEQKVKSVINLFSSEELTTIYMNRVIEEWRYSCEHNLTNDSMNKIAYLGQAACALYDNVPCIVTMNVWRSLPIDIRLRADEIAKQTLIKWIQNQKSRSTFANGKVKDTQRESQTKLPFVWKKEV